MTAGQTPDQRVGDGRLWVGTFASVVVVYLLTAHWYGIVNNDTIAAAWPGWQLAHHHSLFLDHDAHPAISWFVQAHGHVVSNRMAGVVLVGVPLQFLLAPLHVYPLTPAVLTGVLTTAAAVATAGMVLLRLSGSRALAGAVALALAFGTGLWTNAGAELWTHGPDVLWLSLALLALERHRLWWAGVAFMPALWTRPHLAVAAAAVGGLLAVRRRSVVPALALGAPAAVALAGLMTWNHWLFGRWSVAGGYDAVGNYSGRAALTGARASSVLHEYVVSVAGTFISPLHGLVVYSPFLLVGAAALRRGLRHCPDWAMAAAVAGLSYQCVQWRLNGFTGGLGQYGYRLPLEWLVLSAPAALLGYLRLREAHPRLAVWTRGLVGTSVAVHLVGAFWYAPLSTPNGQNVDAWTTWQPWVTLAARGPAVQVIALLSCLAVILGCVIPAARLRRGIVRALPTLAPLLRDPSAGSERPAVFSRHRDASLAPSR